VSNSPGWLNPEMVSHLLCQEGIHLGVKVMIVTMALIPATNEVAISIMF
jgi:hypothetical protein